MYCITVMITLHMARSYELFVHLITESGVHNDIALSTAQKQGHMGWMITPRHDIIGLLYV